MTKLALKPFYRLNKEVEYSTDFGFFLEHQIAVSKSGDRYNLHSMIEKKSFAIEKNVFGDRTISNSEILIKCEEIHKKILAGEYGQGELVD